MYLNFFLGGSEVEALGLSDRAAAVEVRGRVERGLLEAGLRGVAGVGVIVFDRILSSKTNARMRSPATNFGAR
jgi:hypothetical protein